MAWSGVYSPCLTTELRAPNRNEFMPSAAVSARFPTHVGVLTPNTFCKRCTCCAVPAGRRLVETLDVELRAEMRRKEEGVGEGEGEAGLSSTVDAISAVDAAPRTASISRMAMYNTRLATTRSSSLYQPAASTSGAAGTSGGTSGRGTLVSILSSTVVVGATVAMAVVAAVRSKLKAVRECACCQGYGVERCKLCEGRGTIQWEGKMAHREPCPMCLGRRLVKCGACGGGLLFSRALFTHKANKGEDAIMETLETLTTLTTSRSLFGRRAGGEDEARIAASEEFSKEILTD